MFKSYLIVAARNLVGEKMHNTLNIFGLAVGLAAGMIIAIHIREELSYEKAIPGYENIYRVHRNRWATSSPPLAREFREFFPAIEIIGRFAQFGTHVVNTDKNNPGEATGFYADSAVLELFDYDVLEGDSHHPLTAVNTLVITRQMATRYFGAQSPIGQILKLDNGKEMPITAVIENPPVNSHIQFDFLISMSTFYQEREWADQSRGWMTMYTYFRLHPDMINNISLRMPAFIRKFYDGGPDIEKEVADGGWQLMPLKDIHLHSNMEKEMQPNSNILYIYVFAAVEILILIVASANFMSLFTTQAMRRMKEVGIRKVMGAKRGQLIAQFLTEVTLLTLISLALSVTLYVLAVPFYNDLTGKTLEAMDILSQGNLETVGLLVLIVILISGLYPAFFIAGFKSNLIMKDRIPHSTSGMVRNGIVVFQFFVSVALIASAILVRQQMALIKTRDLGFDKDQVVNVKLYGALSQRAFLQPEVFRNEFLSNPDILEVGRTDRIIGERLSIENVVPEGRDPNDEELPDVRVMRVDEGYLAVMNIEVVAGRNFSREFNDSTSFIVNQSAAKALDLNDPVNTTILNESNNRKGRIVGVIKDFNFASLHAPIEPMVMEYRPGWTDNLILKIRGGKIPQTLDYISGTVDRLTPNSLFIYQFLDDRIDTLYKSEDNLGKVFQFFSVLAIIIATLGLFGLSSYIIERRTREIGIRKVLGASVTRIMVLVSGRFFRLILAGYIVAVPLTWYGMSRWLDRFAYKIEIHGWVFVATGVLVLLIAAMAMGFRTLRAASANPVHALRAE